jgi:hypothetical protein
VQVVVVALQQQEVRPGAARSAFAALTKPIRKEQRTLEAQSLTPAAQTALPDAAARPLAALAVRQRRAFRLREVQRSSAQEAPVQQAQMAESRALRLAEAWVSPERAQSRASPRRVALPAAELEGQLPLPSSG